MMYENLYNFIWEPGAWVLLALMLFALINLIASVHLRPYRARLLSLVKGLHEDLALTRAEKSWISYEIVRSRGTHLLVAAIFAPFALVMAFALGLYEGWRQRGREMPFNEGELAVLKYNMMIDNCGEDIRNGRMWADPRRKEVSQIAERLEEFNNPISAMWLWGWMVLSLPFLGVSYLISGSVKPFFRNLWHPLQRPIRNMLDTLHHRHI